MVNQRPRRVGRMDAGWRERMEFRDCRGGRNEGNDLAGF